MIAVVIYLMKKIKEHIRLQSNGLFSFQTIYCINSFLF